MDKPTKYQVGEKVYKLNTILADRKVIVGIKARRWMKPLYLVSKSKDDWFIEAVSESSLFKAPLLNKEDSNGR